MLALATLVLPQVASAQSAPTSAPSLVAPLTPSETPIEPSTRHARAPDVPVVPLAIDVAGSVTVESAAGRADCTGPCVLQVAPGYVRIRAAGSSVERHIDGPSRLRLTEGVAAVRTAGLVALGAGAVVLVAAVALPLVFCEVSPPSRDAFRRPQSTNPCRDISDSVKVAWIGAGAIALTSAIVGTIVYATSAPQLQVEPASSTQVATRIAIAPWVSPTGASTGGDRGIEVGMIGVVRF